MAPQAAAKRTISVIFERQKLLGSECNAALLPETVPEAFRKLRPWVHQGWEMVLLAAELIRPNSPLVVLGSKNFSENYQLHCKAALKTWHLDPDQLQSALDNVRRQAIKNDRDSWLASYRSFPGVAQRLNQLNEQIS